jgi:hypothetical protein
MSTGNLPLQQELIRGLTMLENYEFSPKTADVQNKLGWSSHHAAEIEVQAKQFFSLAYLDPGYYHIPEVDVDDYWHRMILHTVWYIKLCDDVFGSYYHHTPEPNPDNMSRENRERSIKLGKYWFGTEWRNLVKTCTQCKSKDFPVVMGLAPEPETMPPF